MKAIIAVLATTLLTLQLAMADDSAAPGPIIGIGTELKAVDGHPVVDSVLPNSAAQKIGIKPGDRILKINGKTVDGLTLQQVADSLHGAVGTRIHVLVQRGDRQKSFSTRREILVMPGTQPPGQSN